MESFFNIRYEFDRQVVLDTIDRLIDEDDKGYICVADGVTLAMSQRYRLLREVLEKSVLNICDSGWAPVYIKWIYGIKREQYSGTDLFRDAIARKKYSMFFLGTSNSVLRPLRETLSEMDPRIADMSFLSLPYRAVEDFDYEEIAEKINEKNPDIVWVSLGMPKQEIFMYHLLPLLDRGVLIGVGAAFKFMSGVSGLTRAPAWMIKCKVEWLYRICKEPKKQVGRCWLILKTTPGIIMKEYKKKKSRQDA